jgi:hypothetical protein
LFITSQLIDLPHPGKIFFGCELRDISCAEDEREMRQIFMKVMVTGLLVWNSRGSIINSLRGSTCSIPRHTSPGNSPRSNKDDEALGTV